jgi:hypothetical protein
MFASGITAFRGLTAYSGFYGVRDITFYHRYSTFRGFTGKEITHNFAEFIESAPKIRMTTGRMDPEATESDLFDSIMKRHGGYSRDGKSTVIGPESILNLIDSKVFKRYRYDTGGPDFPEQLRPRDDDFSDPFDNITSFKSRLPSSEADTMSPLSTLLRAGYLTIGRIAHVGVDVDADEPDSSIPVDAAPQDGKPGRDVPRNPDTDGHEPDDRDPGPADPADSGPEPHGPEKFGMGDDESKLTSTS